MTCGCLHPTLQHRLECLSLQGNELTGTIPEDLTALVSLKEVNLSGNRLTGGIPESICTLSELRTLALNGNLLTGLVPLHLGEPPQNNLTSVRLQDNNLCGYGPPGLLRIIGQGRQVLLPSGLCLPDELGTLGDEVEYLDLSDMGLDGWLPPSIGELTILEELYLSANQLSVHSRSLQGTTRNPRKSFSGESPPKPAV